MPSPGFHLITPRGLCLLPFLVDSVPEWTSPLLADITSRGERAKDWDSSSRVSLQRILLRLTTQAFPLPNPKFLPPNKNENGSNCYCYESPSECTAVQYAAYVTYSCVNQLLLLPLMSWWVSLFFFESQKFKPGFPWGPDFGSVVILICVSKYVFNGTNQNVKCRWHIWEKGEF